MYEKIRVKINKINPVIKNRLNETELWENFKNNFELPVVSTKVECLTHTKYKVT